MKPNHAKRRIGGFTGWDLLVVAVTVVLAASVGLAYLTRPRHRPAHRISCVSNLKQIGLAFRMWSNDHGDKFPWDVATGGADGGTKEFAGNGEAWRHFQAISNEVNTPKVFVCGTDTERKRVVNWDSFTNNSHLSYFAGLDADETRPQTILSGDRNLAVSNKLLKGVVSLTSATTLEWTTSTHNKSGNIGLADGSAAQVTTQILNKQLQTAFLSTTQATLRFTFPQ